MQNSYEEQEIILEKNNGQGYPIFSGKKVQSGLNDLTTVKPELAAQWHPAKNGDLTPQDVTAGSHKKVWWLCDKGHEWEAEIKSRNSGRGCSICHKGSTTKKPPECNTAPPCMSIS